MTFRTRFAPSPTGPLHLGHAYSALLAYDKARAAGGDFILRIEDTDTGRCRPEHEAAIYEDLTWLGLKWQTPVMLQSERLSDYDRALTHLIDQGYCYPCSCSRRDIREALSAPQEGIAPNTPDGPLYPGTCRQRTMDSRTATDAIRLNMAGVLLDRPDIANLTFTETGPDNPGIQCLTETRLRDQIGDIVLARRDIHTASYHLAVTVDDAAQGITDVIRGQDLYHATFIHRLLQALLDYPTPTYHHHRLIRDSQGKRLAKRTDAQAIRTFRENGCSVDDIRTMVGL